MAFQQGYVSSEKGSGGGTSASPPVQSQAGISQKPACSSGWKAARVEMLEGGTEGKAPGLSVRESPLKGLRGRAKMARKHSSRSCFF